MANINIATTGHGSKAETYAGGLTINYNIFPNSSLIEKSRLTKVTTACNIINTLDKKINLNDPCNKYFKSLPNGRSFQHYWRDNTIFVDFSPSIVNGFFGATHSNNKDICISAWCLDTQNKWMIAATIVHEFAHIGGAPGGSSHAAEKAADMCGFKPQYDPTIMGSIKKLGNYLEQMA